MIAATDAKKVTKRNDLTTNLIIKEILLVDALFFSLLDFFSLFVFSGNEAENARSDASRRSALRQKLAEKIEGIIREWVRPMQNIDSIKVVDVNGLPGFSQGGGSAEGGDSNEGASASSGGYSKKGSLADNVVNSALRYRAQQPFLDSLLKEIGMSPGEASNIRNILGDYDDPKKDKHMRFDEDAKKNPKKK